LVPFQSFRQFYYGRSIASYWQTLLLYFTFLIRKRLSRSVGLKGLPPTVDSSTQLTIDGCTCALVSIHSIPVMTEVRSQAARNVKEWRTNLVIRKRSFVPNVLTRDPFFFCSPKKLLMIMSQVCFHRFLEVLPYIYLYIFVEFMLILNCRNEQNELTEKSVGF
jgi:hypothetical protein